MSARLSDRHLLFGLIALQNNFITRDDLLAAFQTWMLDKSRDLGAILVDNGRLRPSVHQLLAKLADEHLHDHNQEVESSLADLECTAAVARDVMALGDTELTASVAASARIDPDADDRFAATLQVNSNTAPHSRFHILRPHARGGLGQVFLARDQEVNREVALKEIKTDYAFDTLARDRFLREAEITGQLEHPGIVPVYGLGVYPDGRPYYAMRFIKGESLQQSIDAFHAARSDSSRLSGQYLVQFRQLLNRFITVCQAMHYAHSRGVVHRDLKPENIMLGDYGETLVVDWGLAKSIGVEENVPLAGSERPVTAQHSSGSETLAGSALGTPEYMSPEQAAGRLDLITPATDVYALGATLYCLLTGTPPYQRKEEKDIFRAIQQGNFLPPRERWSAVPRPLEAICLQAMQLEPCDRYQNAREVAEELERWLADEPVRAYREPFTGRFQRWMRKNPTFVTTGATAAMLLILASSTISVVVGGYTQVLQTAHDEIVNKSKELELANQQLSVARSIAEKKQLEEEKVTDFLLDSFCNRQESTAFHISTFEDILGRATAKLNEQTGFSDEVKRELWAAFGQSYASVANYDAAIDALHKARALYEKAQQSASAEPRVFEEALRVEVDLANTYIFARRTNEAIPLLEQVIANLHENSEVSSDRVRRLEMHLSYAYRQAERFSDAVQLARVRHECDSRELGAEDPLTLGSLVNLAFEYHAARQCDEAIEALRVAIEHMQRKSQAGDQLPAALNSLAYVYLDAGRAHEALDTCRQIAALPNEQRVESLKAAPCGALLLLPQAVSDWKPLQQHAEQHWNTDEIYYARVQGLLALRSGDFESAARHFETAQLWERTALDHFALAIVFAALEQHHESRTQYEAGVKALEQFQQDPFVHLRVYEQIAAAALQQEAASLCQPKN